MSPPEAGGEGDQTGRRLLPFYVAYRAVVRAKVEGMQVREPEVPEAQRGLRGFSAEAHWRLALGTLEDPLRRPALVLVGGLPGTGKSTLSRGLAQAANFTVIRSDEVRKELAGIPVTEKGEGIYTPEWTSQTYIECGRRAEAAVRDGGRVIVDASFAERRFRAAFLVRAGQLGVPAVFFVCRTDPELVRQRLRARQGDASDADERVYEELAARWEADDRRFKRQTVDIDTTDAGRALEQALGVLRGMGLV
jgi:predicted kinase